MLVAMFRNCQRNSVHHVVIGDFNGRDCKGAKKPKVGPCGSGDRNECRETLLEWCIESKVLARSAW